MSIVAMVPSSKHPAVNKTMLARCPGAGMAYTPPLRIGFWGTLGLFSQQVLRALLTHYTLVHVGLPASAPGPAVVLHQPPPATADADELLLVNQYVAPDTVQIAWQEHIPTYALQRLQSAAVAQWLADQALDVLCVACFPWRIPPSLLTLPTYGFLNLHPSLLPAYRGPAPLFWQLRDGQQTIGVTAHWMDAEFDTGAIAAQQALALPDGATSAELDRICAATGADLLCQVLQQLERGQLVQQPQSAGGSQHPWPTAADFRLSSQWSARHAYSFMCGTDEWQQPYSLAIDGQELLLRRALAYAPTQRLDRPLLLQGREVLLQLRPGVLQALLW